MPQDGVFEGSTDFDALDNPKPKPNRRDTVWDGDLNTPPPGIPANFWNAVVNLFPNEARLLAKAGSDPNYRFDGGMTAGQLYQHMVQNAQQQWDGLNEGGRQQYLDADAAGNPFDPFTARGKAWTAENAREDDKQEGMDALEGARDYWLPQLQGAAEAAALGDEEALRKMEELLGSIEDPEIREYVGDYISQAAQAAPSQEAIDRQKAAYDKTWALTDVQETAEEKLMREMARRQQEQDLKAQRGAFANDLQARGVYGSGAELTMNLAASQEAANRRAMEEMTANANAQQRAMMALEQAGVMSGQIRDAEAQESQFRGTAADRAAEFNKKLKSDYDAMVMDFELKRNKARFEREKVLPEMIIQKGERNFGRTNTVAGHGLGYAMGMAGQGQGFNAPVHDIQDTEIKLADRDETLRGMTMIT